MSAAPDQKFIDLFHFRWTVPILAELHRHQGAKFITLTNRLEISRESLSRTLDILIERGWVMHNPGHGHPLRPEYLLTKTSNRLAPACDLLMKSLHTLRAEEIALRKWSMPVTLAIGRGLRRFSELRTALPDVTPRALTSTLKDLQPVGLVRRIVTGEYPPTSAYDITPRAARLIPILDRL